MKQHDFEAEYAEKWEEFQSYLDFRRGLPKAFRRKNAVEKKRPFAASEFPERYKALCHNLALARARGYSQSLITRLNRLAVAGHHKLYSARSNARRQWVSSLLFGFPVALRANAYFVLASSIAFFLPLLAMGLACFFNSEMIYSLMAPESVNQFESMYEPGRRLVGRERDSASDVMMFGFYIKNNIGISFQSFAGGVLFGVGSLFVMIYNGIYIGGVAGHLAQLGYGETFFPFVSGHSAFELLAIVFSGAAGFKIGYALLAPGAMNRKTALRLAGREAAWIIYGTTVMLLIAAFIEAFWSSKTGMPPLLKYSVGAALWAFVVLYCLFAGGGKNATE